MKNYFLFLCFIIFMIPCGVYAHPGRTDSSGCHTCKTNCGSWGLNQGEYHCHNGDTYSNSRGQIFNKDGSLISNGSTQNYDTNSYNNSNNNVVAPVYIKSSDANLGTLKIDGENIVVSGNMTFTTTNNNPIIEGFPSHNKATIKINKPNTLSRELLNEVTITVTAEDSTIKEYKLTITLVSNDASIKELKIKDKEIEITDEMFFSTTDSEINVDVTPNDIKARILSKNKHKLDIGDNKIIIKLLAEDNVTEKEYVLNVKREKILSSNVGITVTINGEAVVFNNNQSEKIYINSDINEIDIKYELKDKNARTDLKYDKNMKQGERIIKFKVIAENGYEQEYILNLYKYGKTEDMIYTIIAYGLIGGVGFGIYKLLSKLKK